ncbi:hypothetical protein D3C73_1546480 [compost metagenome]
MSDSRRRPRRHVIISVNTTMATSSGSQPPSWILNTLAENSSTSNSSKKPSTPNHSMRFTPVEPRGSTAKASTDVVSIVPVTANP